MTIDDVAEFLGEELTFKICEALPGAAIYIPKKKINLTFQALVNCVGKKAAADLQEKFPCCLFYVPNFKNEKIAIKWQEIIDNYHGGSVIDYAKTTGLSGRQVYYIFKANGITPCKER